MLRCFGVVCVVLCCLVAVGSAADTIWDYQAVDADGYGIHPKVWADETDPNSRVTVEGVALAGFDELLDPNLQYTVLLQDDTSDRGGMQAWTGKFFYGDAMWATLRSTDYVDFQAGDRLRITGLIADMGRGKVVINNRGHSGSPNLVWHVEVLGHAGLPDPELIPSAAHCNYFDQTRAGGGERYQTRHVMLHGVEISGGTWGNRAQMTISDATGSVGLHLSAVGDFSANPQPMGKLSVVGIFDQEDNGTAPYTDGYRLWVKRMSDIAASLDACREVRSRDVGERVALVNKVVSRVYDGYFYIQDENRCGGVKVVSDRVPTPGSMVSVHGVVTAGGNAEAVTANYLSCSRQGSPPDPLFVNSSTLWCSGELDVNGLLVRVFATMGTDQGDGVYSLVDDSGRRIHVKASGVAMPTEGSKVVVTAVASTVDGAPLLLLASDSDIRCVTD